MVFTLAFIQLATTSNILFHPFPPFSTVLPLYYSFTTQSEVNTVSLASNDAKNTPSGTDIYTQLDKYFAEASREIALAAPQDDITLIQYIVPSFGRYNAGAQSANRLLNYVNRHYVKRAVDEDRGWLRLTDIIEAVAKKISMDDSREMISQRFKDKRLEELKKWGYSDSDSGDQVAFAESCAEAASSLDRVVPISSLALRRFRTEFIDPLLATPKIKGNSKAKNKVPKSVIPNFGSRPKGRLARAVKELLESDCIEQEERLRLASGLAKVLLAVGVRHDHLLRKRLDKYLTSVATTTFHTPSMRK